MNIYGERAMRHWREWLPEQFAAIVSPERSFTALGLWISDEVARIEFELLPREYYAETDFMARVGHRGMARLRAEEMVLHTALPAPDPADDHDDELPDTWSAIFEARVIDVEDVVLRPPQRVDRGEHGRQIAVVEAAGVELAGEVVQHSEPRQAARRDGHLALDDDWDLDAALDDLDGAPPRGCGSRLLPRSVSARR